jgi:hypothetical protein
LLDADFFMFTDGSSLQRPSRHGHTKQKTTAATAMG